MSNATYIKSSFQITLLPNVEGVPTYQYIHKGHFKLKTNARSINSDLEGGGNDILGLVMHQAL